MTRIALVLVAATVTATVSVAEAQTITSFERLALLVNQGDRVTVTDGAGQNLRGRIVDLSPSTISLQMGGARRDLHEAEVSVIRRSRHDSLKNGAIMGAISGAVVATILMADDCVWQCYPATATLVTSLFGAAGAGIGVGVDALVEGSQVVYRARRSARRLSVAPLLSRDRRGLALSVGF